MRALFRPFALSALTLCSACSSASSAPPATPPPSSPPASGAGGQAPAAGDLASARALPAGPAISFTIGCQASFFVGPFDLERSGETVSLVGTNRSLDGSQVCAPAAEWVDGSGAFVAVAGFACAEGTDATTSEISYEYSPDNGGNAADPVYLHVRREDPAGCVSTEITLARR